MRRLLRSYGVGLPKGKLRDIPKGGPIELGLSEARGCSEVHGILE